MYRIIKTLGVAIACALVVAMTAGCMSEKEYQLRAKDIQAKGQWPATYTPLAIKGPLQLDANSELIITVPNMPYTPTNIPDGQAYQLKALQTGAMVGGAVAGGYFIKRAAGNGGNTYNTTNNNAGGGE